MDDEAVKKFLLTLKRICAQRGKVYLVPRDKNTQDMLDLNLSFGDVLSVCNSLTPKDLYNGPCRDDDGSSGDIWIFTKKYRGIPLYVKLKLLPRRIKVLSFHEEEKS